MIEERGFEIVFRAGGPVGEPGEFEDVGIADDEIESCLNSPTSGWRIDRAGKTPVTDWRICG
jgi:hypothetical protein